MSDWRRHANNQRQRERDTEERLFRDEVRRLVGKLQTAGPGVEIDVTGFGEEELLRSARWCVRFQQKGKDRVLDPTWTRGFEITLPPVDFGDEEDGFARHILQQVLTQAQDYEGIMTPRSFDPVWITGMQSKVLREEVTENSLQLVVRKKEGAWRVRIRKPPAADAVTAVVSDNLVSDSGAVAVTAEPVSLLEQLKADLDAAGWNGDLVYFPGQQDPQWQEILSACCKAVLVSETAARQTIFIMEMEADVTSEARARNYMRSTLSFGLHKHISQRRRIFIYQLLEEAVGQHCDGSEFEKRVVTCDFMQKLPNLLGNPSRFRLLLHFLWLDFVQFSMLRKVDC